jgi:hypothetical protein
MAKADSSIISLSAHPDAQNDGVWRVAARAEVERPDLLRLQFALEADPLRIRVPSPVEEAGRRDELWAHTCFEAFIGFPESPGYLELNFSPSGQWAAYRFDSYRQGMRPALQAAPRLAIRHLGQKLQLQAEVSLGSEAPGRLLRLALSAVVEDRQGRLSYWAVRHPPGRPDFHHPEGFALALELPGQAASPP